MRSDVLYASASSSPLPLQIHQYVQLLSLTQANSGAGHRTATTQMTSASEVLLFFSSEANIVVSFELLFTVSLLYIATEFSFSIFYRK